MAIVCFLVLKYLVDTNYCLIFALRKQGNA